VPIGLPIAIRWDDVAVLVDLLLQYALVTGSLAKQCFQFSTHNAFGSHAHLLRIGRTMYDSLSCLLHDLLFAALSAYSLEVLEIASIDGCDIFSAEDTNLELLRRRITRREACASAL